MLMRPIIMMTMIAMRHVNDKVSETTNNDFRQPPLSLLRRLSVSWSVPQRALKVLTESLPSLECGELLAGSDVCERRGCRHLFSVHGKYAEAQLEAPGTPCRLSEAYLPSPDARTHSLGSMARYLYPDL